MAATYMQPTSKPADVTPKSLHTLLSTQLDQIKAFSTATPPTQVSSATSAGLTQAQIDWFTTIRRLLWNSTGPGMVYSF